MKKALIIEIISGAFIFLFVYAAVSKLMDLDKFAAQIGQSPILTDINYIVAWAIPITEIVIALLLTTKRTRSAGLSMSLVMMILFSAYIVAILSFGEHIPCACGGVIERLGWKGHLIFNISFVFLAALGIWLETHLNQRKEYAQSV